MNRVIDALNLLLEGPRILWAPIQSTASHPKNPGSITRHSTMFCWLTQEDFARFFFNSIATFSPVADLSVSHLGLVRSTDVFTVHRHDPVLSFLPLISRALHEQTSVAVITHDRKLIGEISPSPLASCDESAAAALAALSAGDLMTYIDWRGSPPEAALRTVKCILKEKGMQGMLELLEGKFSSPMFSSSSSSASSSSDEEEGKLRALRRTRSMGSYSARMGRRSELAIVCQPVSSLAAVMVQLLAHRVGYVWVVDKDYSLVGIVVLRDILKVLLEHLDQSNL
ncbi:CBS domain-containing protein CBSX5-like [Phalaenopsis equestris]|uniref:CBS domain-containing protein CBSX5-like n=1 Tax=Phalaenopsis equestris TaxID=78828 RepID=UPI0009E2C820|nr:CBS domain-containing protein CBSX5-like [Phalaenopsis equestris]